MEFEKDFLTWLDNLILDDPIKLVISNKINKEFTFKKITIDKVNEKYNVSSYTEKQVFNSSIEYPVNSTNF